MKENNKEQERFVAYITKQQCVNEAASVTDFLRKYAFRYHNSAFISSDPVQFPHRYHRKEDIEISGFLTAYLSFGARPQILRQRRGWMLSCSITLWFMYCRKIGNRIFVGKNLFIAQCRRIKWGNYSIGYMEYIQNMTVWKRL